MHQIGILSADRFNLIVSIIITRLVCIKASLIRIIAYCHFLLLINDSFHIILNIKSIAGGNHNIPSRYHFIFIKISTDIGIIHWKRLCILLLIRTGSKYITAWKCSSNRKNRSHHHCNCSLKNLLIHSLFLTFWNILCANHFPTIHQRLWGFSPTLRRKKGTPFGMPFTHQVGSHNQLPLFHCNIINQPFSCYSFYIKNHSDHLHHGCHLLSIRPQLRINNITFKM